MVVATGMLDDSAPDVASTASQIEFYWRPGCGFCSMLQRKLDQLGIERVERNIWDNADDAATVRRHANGNETVPTVVIGDTGFVNPSVGQLVNFLASYHPDLLPERLAELQPHGVGRLADKVFG